MFLCIIYLLNLYTAHLATGLLWVVISELVYQVEQTKKNTGHMYCFKHQEENQGPFYYLK